MFSNELTDYGDTLPDKDENDKLLEQYQETKTEAKATLTRLQQMFHGKERNKKKKKSSWCKGEKKNNLEMEPRNREKQMEINAEIEKDKLRSQERFELERLNLE